MAAPGKDSPKMKKQEEEEEEVEMLKDEDERLISTLPKQTELLTPHNYQFQGFWYPERAVRGVLACRRHFQALSTDLFLVTNPKSGTTWLKALAFAIANRSSYSFGSDHQRHPLLAVGPHDLVPYLEWDLYGDNPSPPPDLTRIPSPRLCATHMPFVALPQSVKENKCRIVYLCRNPRDTFVSMWYFNNKLAEKITDRTTIEQGFDSFCEGKLMCGPFFDHVLGYWKESQRDPGQVLFLRYEEMRKEPAVLVKKLAEFMGFPISLEEERQGVVEEIVKLCSFQKLRNLEVNKTGTTTSGTANVAFFRKGEVGDWINHLSPQMIERLDQLAEMKLQGSGLTFQYD